MMQNGRIRREAHIFWEWLGALGHRFCPRRSKRTCADEIDRVVGVTLINEKRTKSVGLIYFILCHVNGAINDARKSCLVSSIIHFP